MLTTIAIVWALFGIAGYGATLGYFVGEYPYFSYKHRRGDLLLAFVIGLIGPLGLLIAYCESEGFRHGFMFRTLTREESIAAYKKEWPSLTPDF